MINFADKNREFISNVFSSVAEKYDIMNDLTSFGIHRLWKRKFIDIINIQNNAIFTDLSCGTGDIAKLLFSKHKNKIKSANLIDPDIQMLNLSKKRLLNFGISLGNINFIQSTAEEITISKNSQDFITISFGARNFSNIKLGFENCYKALKSGGYLYCMEFSPNLQNQTCDTVYKKYLNHILPKIGKFIAKDEPSYRYLSNSIQEFLTPNQMQNLLTSCGFSYTDAIPLANGGVYIYIGRKEN